MAENEAAPGERGGVVEGEEGMNSRLPNSTATDAPMSTEVRCRVCGRAVGGARDFAANYPFDSECRCGSPFPPAPTFKELAAPNEIWFRAHRDDLGIVNESVPTQNRPRPAVVKKPAPAGPAEPRQPPKRARTVTLG